MSTGFALLAGGSAADDLADAMQSLEIEENADSPGAFALSLPLSAKDGEIDWVGDPRLAPMSPIAVIARGSDGQDQCVFDGYVLAQSIKLKPGVADSSLRVWGQDASWLMNLTEKAREWSGLSDGDVAASIFGDYGMTPGPDNTSDDTPPHTEDGHTLLQRGTDAQFLARLARRSGKLFRVTNADSADARIGVFARPNLGSTPTVTLNATDAVKANVQEIEIAWDVMRPSSVSGGQALLTGSDPATSSQTDSGLAVLDARPLAAFAGQPMEAMLTATVDDAGELAVRTQGLLVESGFFARCTGRADASGLSAVPRVGQLVTLEMAGSVHSGSWYVWSVRHKLTPDHHEVKFELLRNAVGPAPTSGGSFGL